MRVSQISLQAPMKDLGVMFEGATFPWDVSVKYTVGMEMENEVAIIGMN